MRKGFWERVWSRVDKNGPSTSPELGHCWIYKGSLDQNGYPLAHYCGKTVRIYRLIHECARGKIPFGFDIHHLCGTRSCIRLEHLIAEPEEKHVKRHKPLSKRCGKGHNLNGKVQCEVCNRDRANAYYAMRRSRADI